MRSDQILNICSWWYRQYLVMDWLSIERKRDAKHFGLINWCMASPSPRKRLCLGGQAVTKDQEHSFDGCNVSDIQVEMCFHCTFVSEHPGPLYILTPNISRRKIENYIIKISECEKQHRKFI